ncbi:hypothetical protein [Lacinutrix jangbogonensis]|uniref:hypothetical protein n=1 Tax=Lacinutrix jangbogonensis TaxID=1469557 RepID=UPI00053DA438|nr:hypothetical protein [Lacinutrix jangbogonensis]
MKTKALLFLLLICFFNSCTVQFDRNVRIETIGKVVDENNEPIPNTFIGVYTEAARFSGFYLTSGGDDRFLLGSGTSDEIGDFSIISLFDSNQYFFIFVDGKELYTDYIYSSNTYEFEPVNFVFNLGQVQLKRNARANISITRSSLPGTTLDIIINYESPFCESVFTNGVLNEDLSNCFRTESIFITLDDDNPDFIKTLSSFVTGTIEFTYTINGGTETTETFVINQDNYDINFSY